MSIDTSKPSTEIDLAVAEAAGIRAAIQHDRQSQMPRVFCYDSSMVHGQMFRPSTEWKDAMEAGEKVGLFDIDGKSRVLWFDDGWLVGDGNYEIVAQAPTGPLAICAAILKLKDPA